MPKPEAYPFLRIAKEHGVPYEDVLIMAHYFMKGETLPHYPDYDDVVTPGIGGLHDDIVTAVYVQQDIQAGVIDWQTGEKNVEISF